MIEIEPKSYMILRARLELETYGYNCVKLSTAHFKAVRQIQNHKREYFGTGMNGTTIRECYTLSIELFFISLFS